MSHTHFTNRKLVSSKPPGLGAEGPGEQRPQPEMSAVHHREAPAQGVVAAEPLLGVWRAASRPCVGIETRGKANVVVFGCRTMFSFGKKKTTTKNHMVFFQFSNFKATATHATAAMVFGSRGYLRSWPIWLRQSNTKKQMGPKVTLAFRGAQFLEGFTMVAQGRCYQALVL